MTEAEMNARLDQMESDIKELRLVANQLRVLLDAKKSKVDTTMNNGLGKPPGMSEEQWKLWNSFEESRNKIMYQDTK